MSISGGSSASERDLRLDFFRGIALFSIFIDHVDWNSLLAQFTLHSVGFFDAAEVFILISGYTAGMVYGRVIERQGLLRAGMRIYHRVWQLYVAHVFLFMQFMATVAYVVDALNNSIYAEEFRAADFLKEPGIAVIKALTLQFQPEFMDILPLYIVLLAVLPLVLAGFRLWPAGVLAASFGLWVAVQVARDIALPAYPGPDQVWVFNPFAWQALFFLGAWCGWHGLKAEIPWLTKPWLFRLAVAGALAGFLIRFSWTLHWLYNPFPALFGKTLWPLLSKTNLSLLRFANVLVLALLVARLIPPCAAFLASRAAWPCVICGQYSLQVFCLGILLSTIGRLVINEFFGGALLQCVVIVVGIAIMIGTAALMDWFNAGQSTSETRVLRVSSDRQRGMSMAGTFLHRIMSLLAAAGLGLLSLPEMVPAQGQDCAVPASFYDTEPTLPKTAEALASGQAVSIVVLGGASTLGRAAGSPDLAWPARLAVALASRFPATRVTVDNRAAMGQTAQEMASRLEREVIASKPTLVIWEAGTTDAVRNTELDEFRQTMQAGIDRLRASGADVVFMDMQFSRQSHAVINFGVYASVLRETTDANNVPLFRRHDIMHHWAESGLFDLTTGDHKTLPLVASRLYECIGRAMADFVARGVHLGEGTPAASSGSNK